MHNSFSVGLKTGPGITMPKRRVSLVIKRAIKEGDKTFLSKCGKKGAAARQTRRNLNQELRAIADLLRLEETQHMLTARNDDICPAGDTID